MQITFDVEVEEFGHQPQKFLKSTILRLVLFGNNVYPNAPLKCKIWDGVGFCSRKPDASSNENVSERKKTKYSH